MIQINLLPKEYLKKSNPMALGKAGIYMAIAGIGFLGALAALTFFQMNRLNELDANINRASQRAAMLQKDIRLVDGLTDIKNKITRRMTAVERLDRHRTVWVRILEDLGDKMPEFVWLASFAERTPAKAKSKGKAAESDDEASGKKDKEADKKDAKKSGKKAKDEAESAESTSSPELSQIRPIELEGYAFTLNSLAAFMIKLMRSDYFDKVELVSSNEQKLGTDNEKAYQFVISCQMHYLSDEELRTLAAQKDSMQVSDELALESERTK